MTTCNSGTYITDNDQYYIKKVGANKLYVLNCTQRLCLAHKDKNPEQTYFD